jgi:hypothetical protein
VDGANTIRRVSDGSGSPAATRCSHAIGKSVFGFLLLEPFVEFQFTMKSY